VQELATSEAGNLMMVVSTIEDVQEDIAAELEAVATEEGNPDLSHSISVVNVESDSSSSSLSLSSSSSTDSNVVPLRQCYKSIQKGHPTSTKTYKKPSQTIPFEPMYSTINERIGEMSEMRNQVCERLPPQSPFSASGYSTPKHGYT
jgi:hypothetical protein